MLHTINWWWAEFWGTFMLVIILNGGIASDHLDGGMSSKSGRWYIGAILVVCVVVPVSMFGKISGMFNPAVTLAKYAAGIIPAQAFVTKVLPDISAQMLGAMASAIVMVPLYWDQFKATENSLQVNAAFYTSPKIRNYGLNTFSEGFGTFLLVFSVLCIERFNEGAPLMLLSIVLGIMVMGVAFVASATSPALNPARDLGPRIMLSILPVPNKAKIDWAYAWVPVVGPILGGLVAALVYKFCILPL